MMKVLTKGRNIGKIPLILVGNRTTIEEDDKLETFDNKRMGNRLTDQSLE